MAKTVVPEPLPFSPRPNRARSIRWHPWGREAFRTARRENRPVILSITTWWSEECHRMDETSYSDQGVIERVNAGFVAVRVDADRRPDVNDRYTLGGLPTTALLAPGGELLTAGSYLPPWELAGLLDQVGDWYQQNRAELRRQIEEMQARRRELLHFVCLPPQQPSWDLLRRVEGELYRLQDPRHGGFGDEPKFPHPDALRFALERGAQPGGEGWMEVATRSLDAIASALQDPVGGGFFHSADHPDWTGVHTEKLLDVNADLLRLYLEAYRTTGRAEYGAIARRTLTYLDSTLRNPGRPTFGGSQAADPHHYRLSEEARRAEQPPPVDRTVFAEGSGRAALAYLRAFEVLGDAAYLQTATDLLDFVWREMAEPVHGVTRYWDGRPGGPHLLRDQVWVATALGEAYDTTGNDRLLDRATQLAEVILRDYPGTPGGFYDIRAEREPVAGLVDRQWNLVENGQLALLMARLAGFGGDGRYLEAARSALQLFAEQYTRYGPLMATYALGLEAYLRGKG